MPNVLPMIRRCVPWSIARKRQPIPTFSGVAVGCDSAGSHFEGRCENADSDEGGHLFQSDRGHPSNLMAAT
jgi:hypothetical protein